MSGNSHLSQMKKCSVVLACSGNRLARFSEMLLLQNSSRQLVLSSYAYLTSWSLRQFQIYMSFEAPSLWSTTHKENGAKSWIIVNKVVMNKIPAVPAEVICLKCSTTSVRFSLLAILARQRTTLVVSGAGFVKASWLNCSLSRIGTTTLKASILDWRDSTAPLERTSSFAFFSVPKKKRK